MNTRLQRAAVVGAATISALVVWTFSHVVSGIDLAVTSGHSVMHVGAVAVAVTAIVAGLAGWGLLAALEHVTTHARGIWTAIATTVFLVSLLGPLGGTSAAAMGSLAALHATVAAALIVGMLRTGRRPTPCG